MPGPDIVARLSLRAEQFSSEGGRAFAEMATRARSTSADIKQTFSSDLAAVGKIAQQALSMPRTETGSLDLSGEIAQLRASAAAADTRAAAALELRNAMQGAAIGTQAAAEAAMRDADAAMVDARAAEQQAGAIRQRIVQLEAYQVELNKTSSATMAHTRAANDNKVSAEQQRQSTIMLGQQLQDFSVQVVSGQSVATAFAQQIGQASFALQGMGGAMAGVANFLTSGWGIAATIGVTVLAPLVAKILDGNDALDDAVEKLKKNAAETATTARAQDLYAKSAEGVSEAIRAQSKAFNDNEKAQRSAAEQANIAARQELDRQIAIRATTVALLERAEAEYKASQSMLNQGGGATQLVYAQQLDTAQKAAEKARTDLAAAQQNVERSKIDLAVEAAKRAADPMARLNKLYDDQTALIRRTTEEAIKNGRVVGSTTQTKIDAIERERKAAIKAEQDRQTAANRKPPSLGSQITAEQGTSILSSAQKYVGAREDTASGKATLKDLFSPAGINIDPEKTAWCAAFVNAVLAGQGIKGNGSLAAKSFLNYGTATSKPEQGDIVVLKVGKGDHVGFYAGEKDGRVQVTGGNQAGGTAVSTSSFPRSDVEAFRRAPTASAAYTAELKANAEAARAAKKEQTDLGTALDQILGKLDPAGDAARKYAEQLGQIDKLAAAKKIGPDQEILYRTNARKDYNEAMTAASGKELRDVFGNAEIDKALATWNDGIDTAVGNLEEGVRQAGVSFGDHLRDAVGSAMDLLGVRISGPFRSLLQPGGVEGQANDVAKSITDGLKNSNIKISPESLEKLTSGLSSVLSSASYGQIGGSVFSSITGGKSNPLASSLGGVLGGVAGKELGKTVSTAIGGTLGKTLGGLAGPLGSIAGGILGSVVGGLFKKSKWSDATVSLNSSGEAVGTTGAGRGGQAIAAATGTASSVASGINAIADQLGATISKLPALTLGTFESKYRVATTSTTKSLNYNNFNDSVLHDFGSDQQAAIEYAIRYSVSKAVVSGISKASQTILKSGQDLETAISKALLIEAVPKDLKAMLDPVGAAVDELNLKFQHTVDALKEGGATAEQMTQAQQLYDLQLAQVKNSTASATQGLKDFLTSLKIGSDSPYSLRDQEQTAKADLAPFLTQIAAGQSIDQDKYQAAAQAYLDVERQLYGSTKAYFDALDAVQAATNKAISTVDNATPVSAAVESPFAKATATSSATTATNTQTANELLDQVSQQAQVTNDLLARLLTAAGGSDTGSFIGSARNFAAAA
ncbi:MULTISPECIES: TIGR02594 family protein [unclassified Sphingomonas]|uniref:TIGR02594 family protein n=1 Tax=unclassified Sphingomonas TaxID=196159 RepID=UPI00226A1406|nr:MULTISPECIES: TIGR02594 family protein [unclassified Sphingomonas]